MLNELIAYRKAVAGDDARVIAECADALADAVEEWSQKDRITGLGQAARVAELEQQVAALQLAGGAAVAKLLPPTCRNCGHPLKPANERVADGCPCNSPRGINHGLVPTHVCTCPACDPDQTGSVRRPPWMREADDLRARVDKLTASLEYEHTLRCAAEVVIMKLRRYEPKPDDVIDAILDHDALWAEYVTSGKLDAGPPQPQALPEPIDPKLRARVAELEGGIVAEARRTTKEIDELRRERDAVLENNGLLNDTMNRAETTLRNALGWGSNSLTEHAKGAADLIASLREQVTQRLKELGDLRREREAFKENFSRLLDVNRVGIELHAEIARELGSTDIVPALRARLKELVDEKQRRARAEAEVQQHEQGLATIQAAVAPHRDPNPRLSPQKIADEIQAQNKNLVDCRQRLMATEADLTQAWQSLIRIQSVVAPKLTKQLAAPAIADEAARLQDDFRTLEKIARDLLNARSEQSWPEHRFFDALIAFFSERAVTCNKGDCNEHCELPRGHAGPHLYRSPCPPCNEKPMTEKCDYQENINGDVVPCRRRRGHSGQHTYSVNDARKLDNVLTRDELIAACEEVGKAGYGPAAWTLKMLAAALKGVKA